MAEPVASTESAGGKRRWSHGICGATGARKLGWQWPLDFGPAAILLHDFPIRQDLAGAWHWEQISPPLLRMLSSGIQLGSSDVRPNVAVRRCKLNMELVTGCAHGTSDMRIVVKLFPNFPPHVDGHLVCLHPVGVPAVVKHI